MGKARKQGHPSVFTPAQNRKLREELRGYSDRAGLSQASLGEALGVTQQVAGRLLGKTGGFSYRTATRLAHLLGFDGVDAFFVARGVGNPTQAATGTDG